MGFKLANTMLLSGVFITAPAIAQQQTDVEDSTKDVITVIGTRTERPMTEVPVTVSVKTSDDINGELTRDISDLVRYEPGVSVGGTGSRFGLQGFSIRGIGGNRVLTVVDGVRMPEEFSFGPFLSARRDFVDIDSVDRVEIARGPISSLYGSDALGGVVAFTTRGPQDLVSQDDPFYADGKLGWSSVDESTVARGTVAFGGDQLSAMLSVTQRDGSETENAGSVGGFGPDRELPDGQDLSSTNVLAKVNWQIAESQSLTLTVDTLTIEVDTEVFSDYGSVVFGTTVNTRDAFDERDRTRVSLAYRGELDWPIADTLMATVYTQDSENSQQTLETRTPPGPPGPPSQTRERLSSFNQTINGALVQAMRTIELGAASHTLTYGIDVFETESESLRTGGTFALDGTEIPASPFAPPLPTRDFPLTDVRQTAIFLQDEISLLDDRLLITPGLRFDSFDATASADAIYLSGNPGSPTPADYDDSEVTGRLGGVYRLTDKWSLFALYAEGFRAPPYDDVNVGFSNFAGGYKTIANPDLNSERSRGLEAGVRYQSDRALVGFNLFRTDYEEFIESFAIAPAFADSFGVDPADGLLTFQSVNREDVVIEGAELSAEVDLAVFESLGNLRFRSAIAYADGEDKSTSLPIDSVEPLSAVFGLKYQTLDRRWGGELVWTVVDAKDEADISDPTTRLPTDGYGIVDLLFYGNITDSISVNAGLFNVGDKEYTRWIDSAGIGTDSPLRFTQPGFNTAINLQVAF
ncbi:MAG: TonB-dependent hemoglobin/transferrin/lactoferrin family receptor [Pseudomonadota bacterium]